MSNTPPDDYDPPADRRLTTRQTRRSGGWLNLIEPIILTWRLVWDGRVTILPKLIPIAAAVYVISPVDLMPELALGPLGVLDDVGIVILALNLFIGACPPALVEEHRRQLGFSTGVDVSPDSEVVDGSAESPED